MLLIALPAEAAGPKRVLILHSFGRDFAPYDAIASTFRTDLARRFTQPITFVEANLDYGRAVNEKEERVFVEYLRARFESSPPDVVVTIGPPAARFYLGHREELFGRVPMVMGALDERLLRGNYVLLPGDAVVAGRVELPRLVENILQLLPTTRTIAVVGGASELERFWQAELKRETAPFADRVKFEWLNDLSLAQMQERVASLPPHSAVLYGLFILDAAGIPHERQEALASLRAATSAPIFGLYESELGKGVVGGPYTSQRKSGEYIASATLRALGGSAPAGSGLEIVEFAAPVYDSRELARWDIPASRLPPGSEVRFTPPSIWEEHRTAVVATATAIAMQALLIMALLVQRVRRRRAEREAAHLGGRILTAQEDERRRLAREMHDDVTQRLAALAIDAAKAQGSAAGSPSGTALEGIRERLAKLSEDVHALSYRLHPSMIEDLGLVAALRAECNRVAREEPLRVGFESQSIPRKVPAGTSLCLFRVAQEALRNVVRHASATSVDVSLEMKHGGLALAVRDDGAGFDARGSAPRTSLGLVSMQERVHLVGGRIEIVTRRDHGTSVVAWVPLKEAA